MYHIQVHVYILSKCCKCVSHLFVIISICEYVVVHVVCLDILPAHEIHTKYILPYINFDIKKDC